MSGLVICIIVYNVFNNFKQNNSLQDNLSQEEIDNLSPEEINKFFNQDKFKNEIDLANVSLDDIFIFIKLTSQALKKNPIESETLLHDHYLSYEKLFKIQYINPTFLNIFDKLHQKDNYIKFINYYIDNQQQQEYLFNYLKFSYFLQCKENFFNDDNSVKLLDVLSCFIKKNLSHIKDQEKKLSINILKYYNFKNNIKNHLQLEDLNNLITNIEDRKHFIKEYNENYNNRYLLTNNKNKLGSKLLEINNNNKNKLVGKFLQFFQLNHNIITYSEYKRFYIKIK